MSYALNEVEAMAKRATRGAGYEWGLAEEAAKATRWLCAQGLDGANILAGVLGSGERDSTCPLSAGAGLSDRATLLSATPSTLNGVTNTAMLLPFAALAARQTGAAVIVTCGDARAVTDGNRLSLTGSFPIGVSDVEVHTGGALEKPTPPATRANPDPDAWEVLGRLAHRTYAPATEESRMLGAGAGLLDND